MKTRLRGIRRGGSVGETLGRTPAEHGPVGPCHEVGAWLDVLCKLIRLPREQTEGIRAELEEHLRERVRDLMVEGEPESAATRRAISELGDAAALADRFRRAEHAPRRRMLMNIAMLGMAAGVAVAGAVGLNRLSGQPGGVQSPPQVRYASADVGEKTVTLPAEATMEKFVQELGRVTGKGTHVYWDSLQELGVAKDSSIDVPLVGVSIETALMLVNERVKEGSQRVACRVTGNLLEVSTLQHFDKRDMTLVAYDVESALATIASEKGSVGEAEQLTKLITNVIDAEQWKSNGGDLAELYMVGPKLFVKAPARFQPTVQWILVQLGSAKAGTANAGSRAIDEPMMLAAQGDRVMMSRGGSRLIADSIVVDPASDRVRATGTVLEMTAAPSASKQTGLVYLSGSVPRPGVYNLPEGGLSLRRLLVSAGVSTERVREVVVSSSEAGNATVVHRLSGDELRSEKGKDPALAKGEAVEVK